MNNQLQFLKQSIKNGHVSHAYLFYGGLSELKKETAIAFAQELTGHQQKWISNPDLMIVDILENEDKILIEQMRKIKKFLSFEPYLGKNKVVIVNNFEQMKEETASSILKILEEPPKKSILILLCNNPHALLPTILSRVQKISFSDVDISGIDNIAKALYNLEAIIGANIAERINIAEKIIKNNSDLKILDEWISLFRDFVYITIGDNELVANKPLLEDMQKILKKHHYSIEQISSILSEIMYWSYVAKTTNTNKRLVLENIVLML